MLGTLAAHAYDFEADGIYYNITSEENKTVAVTEAGGDIEYSGNVVIPETVVNFGSKYTVTGIGPYAFLGCAALTNVEIPSSVTVIGFVSFRFCSSLECIKIPASVKEIGWLAFADCTSVEFITCDNPTPPAIDSTAFEGNKILAIYVPSESVKAYKAADVWKDYNIQDIQTKIDGFNTEFKVDSIYYHVTSLENKTVEVVSGDVEYSGDVVIPKTVTNSGIEFAVTSIGKSAFYKCFTLTSVDIQADILSISKEAFSDSWRLKSIKIPSTVTSIGENAFYECESLESIDLPESLTEIGKCAFQYCVSLDSINIPNLVSEIGYRVFAYCAALKDIEIPSSVISIGEEAFRNCGSLKNINIPASVTSIGDWAFLWSGLENIIISSPGTKIANAFQDCCYLKSAEIASAVIGHEAFYGCTALTNVVLKLSVTSIGDQAFNSCYSLESVDIPASLSYIGSGVFSGCWALKKINVSEDNMYYSSVDGVLYDKDKRTLMCYPGGLEGKFEIPNTVEKIGAWAFYQSAVSDIKIPASVSTIDLCAFYGSGLLSSVELPSSVTMIDNLAFYYCKSLETVKCNNTTPPTISSGTFDQSPIEVFYVPNEAVSAYKEADVWKYYNIQGSQKKLELMATGIENTTFSGSDTVICYTLQGMRVPGVRTMDDVKSLTPGVYICVQGNKATKVLVK
jgi:hypothetical protein